MLVSFQDSSRNGSLVESNDFEKALGRPITPISEALTQIVNEIS
jgi:NAD(P)H dehydrogenase (quinone)